MADYGSRVRATARRAALLYPVMGIPGWINLMYLPGSFIVPGDAAATARAIATRELTYRLGVFSGLVSGVGFLLLALTLYSLFQEVDRKLARLLVALVAVSVAIETLNLLNQLAPLVLLGGGSYLSVFSRAQLEALALGFLRLFSAGAALNDAFWGLWLFPFGLLVMKSGFFPKILGVFLVVGCFAYLAVSFTAIVLPAQVHLVSQVALPFFALAELPIWLWLLVKGAQVPHAPPAAAHQELVGRV